LLSDLGKQYKRENMRLAHEALLALETYDWPGNIRQLFNALEYALVHADGQSILPHHLPPEIERAAQPACSVRAPEPLVRTYYRPLQPLENEIEIISRVLAETGGNKAEAARRLGMSRTTLWKRLRQGV
jgi:DNA-binding NtrC family response regulator